MARIVYPAYSELSDQSLSVQHVLRGSAFSRGDVAIERAVPSTDVPMLVVNDPVSSLPNERTWTARVRYHFLRLRCFYLFAMRRCSRRKQGRCFGGAGHATVMGVEHTKDRFRFSPWA